MATVAGITVGHGNLLVSPVLHPAFGSNLGNIVNRQMTEAGRSGGNSLVSSISASTNAGPVRARFGLIGKGLAAAVVGGFAAAGVGAAISKIVSTGIDEVKDYQSGLARLNAGLKSTGNVAGITSSQMEDLASNIEGYSGQTDDSIVATEQLLLTFTNVKNVAGQGNDVFTQTTKIAADMAARLGGDASGAAIQLGKALNDPVVGITALTRVGVSFDDSQKSTIKTLVESGNTLGAQKIILGELNKEFGGSAKAVGDTLPGQIDRAKRSFEGLSQSVVTAALPAFTAVVPALTTAVQWLGPKLEQGVTAAVGVIGKAGKAIAPTVGRIFNQVKPVVTGLVSSLARDAVPILRTFGGVFSQVGTSIGNNVVPIFKEIGNFITTTFVPSFGKVASVVQAAVVPTFHKLGDVLSTDVIPTVRTIFDFVIVNLLPMFARLWVMVQTNLIPAFASVGRVVLDVVGKAFTTVRAIIIDHRAQLATVVSVLGTVLGWLVKVGSWIVQHIVPIVQFLGANVKFAFTLAKAVIDSFVWEVRLLATVFQWAWDTVLHPVVNAFAAAGTWLWNTVLKPIFGFISSAWSDLGGGLSAVYHNVIEPIWTAIHVALGGVSEAFTWLKTTVKTIWDGIVDVFKTPITLVLGVVNKFDHYVNNVTDLIGLGRKLPETLSLSTGGIIPGGYGGGDRHPVMAEAGEVMLNKEVVRAMGGPQAVHERFNRGSYDRTAHGGLSPFQVVSDALKLAGNNNPLSLVTGAAGAAFDAGKWVVSQAEHILRRGAAAALSAAVAPVRALMNPLGSAGVGGWIHHAGDHLLDQVIDWVKGKEGDAPGANGDPGQWLGGRLAWPVPGYYGISQYFGSHPGIDIPAPFGTPIVAANSGYVTDSGPASGFGNWIRILGQGVGTVYGHMASSELFKRVGELVNAGDVIAGVGSEGNSTGAHLHFEVHPGGFGSGPTDPVPYLRGGVPATVHDAGGWLRPGYAGLNLTGRPEAVLDPDESLALKAVLSGATGGGRPGLFAGATVHIGDNADLELAAARHDWEQRRGEL